MGNCTSKHTGNEENYRYYSTMLSIFSSSFLAYFFYLSLSVLSVNNFQFHFVIGKGGFGKVILFSFFFIMEEKNFYK